MPTFEGFFQPTCDGIINHVKEWSALPVVKDVKIIIMVAAISESPLLQDAIRKAFSDRQMIVPQNVGVAVLKGTV